MGLLRNAVPDLTGIRATSKLGLKLQCLQACRNDVAKAAELYEFLAGDLDLPGLEPEAPTAFSRLKQGADGLLGWIGEHKDEIADGWRMVSALRAKSIATPDAPPIPNI